VNETKGIVILEEHNIYCGLSSILTRIFSENHIVPMKAIGIDNTYGQSGNRTELLSFYGLNKINILEKIKILLNFK
jgi:transketolase